MRDLRTPVVTVLLLVVVAGILTGCAARDASGHPAAAVVEALLELRRADVRDPASYAPLVRESRVATALASPADDVAGTPRVPGWEPPYVSAETSVSADVVVVWKTDEAFTDWPVATVFLTMLEDGAWVVVDAVEVDDPPPAGDESE